MRRFLLALTAALAATGVAAESRTAAEWPLAPANLASAAEIERVAAAFPNSMGMQRRRLAAALEAKDSAVALEAARRLAAAGAGLSGAARSQLAALVGAQAMAALNARFDENIAPIAASEPFTSFPSRHRLIEGLAVHPESLELFGTSVVDRRLVRLDRRDGAVGLDIVGAGSLLGAAFDPRSRRLWVASAILDQTPKTGAPFSGLLSVDPSDPARPIRIPAPAGATLGDVAVAADGTVYASDGLKGAVYACRPGCSALAAVISQGRLFSAQGMAVSRDQKWLYVADRRYGIAAVERSSGRIARLEGGADMMLDGIDGLVAHGRDLIATQTAYAPQRIVRLRLSRDGLRVRKLDVLERANPEWGEVTLAAVTGDRLLYVAGAQWERFGEGGAAGADAPPGPTPIRSLPLR
jgi:hypothetical protein